MPNLKDIRRRIRSVKSTQKITQAMRMVAAAKVKRAENRVKAARPYSETLQQVFEAVYNKVSHQAQGIEGSVYASMLSSRPVKNVGILVVSSDRGLCGGYNSNIIRQALRIEKEATKHGLTPKFYLVGNKVNQAFQRYSQSEKLGGMANMTAAPTVQDSKLIAETLIEAYRKGEIDTIDILSTQFKSMISYKIQVNSVIPLKSHLAEMIPDLVPAHYTADMTPTDHQLEAELLMSPDPAQTLDQIIPMYIQNMIYIQLLEASASELAARMTAMTNATKNAGELIEKLTLQYNKARQGAITQELLEVVSGANAIS